MNNINFTKDDEELALKIVRENITSYLNDKEYMPNTELPEIFNQEMGVFVTLNKKGSLRGCIGYIEAYEPLIDALLDLSLASAFDDPRFAPVTKDEMDDITIEISLLSKPQLIKVKEYDEYLTQIKIGEDGLIIENGYYRGVFLPQVPIEQNWNILQYLENLGYKAGASANLWKKESTKIYKFQAHVFEE